jgi:hypothetical protein
MAPCRHFFEGFKNRPLILAAVLFMPLPALARPPAGLEAGLGRQPSDLYANRAPYVFYHNVGLLTMRVTNVGYFGSRSGVEIGAGWRGGEYLYQSGLWIGAIGSDSEPHVSQTYYFDTELLPDRAASWTIRESYEGQPAGVRIGLLGARAADDDEDGTIDEDFQNGLDDDGDDQIDEDFEAIGQQMLSCMYKDDTPEAVQSYPDHYPLNLLVKQRSFQWSTSGLNEFVGIDFELVNNGEQRLRELYLGFFSDSDAGPKSADEYWTDDLVGWSHIDTTLVDRNKPGGCQQVHLGMDAVYMWDAKDDGAAIHGGDVPGVFGSLFLGHTTDDTGLRAPQNVGLYTVAWFSAQGQQSDPQNDDERYALLSSGTKPTRAPSQPDDFRYLFAAGPFASLNPGEALRFQTAYVIGEGQTGFRANAVSAQRVYNGFFLDLDNNPETGVDGKERCLQILEQGNEIIWDDPCDTLNTTIQIKYTPPCNTRDARYVDADCDPCTGVEGAESLVNWVGTTAPPPPHSNTDPDFRVSLDPAGNRKVVIEWDNASELAVDPITGVKLFRGYRVWRADNWQRPEGSIGPTPEQWMKLAEFRNDCETAGSEGAICLDVPFSEGGALMREVRPIDVLKDGTPVYPVGRYRYQDTSGLLNGKLYFYSVVSFGVARVRNSITGEFEDIELAGLPHAVESESIVPRWDAVNGCDHVAVVPNPYRGGADWDLIPSQRDPTGTKIAFRNLPDGMSKIRIFTLSGDLIQEAQHDGAQGNGTYFWNLISRNGQNVVSGIYLYVVESGKELCRGRFVIIR